jgi:hypothetical protein
MNVFLFLIFFVITIIAFSDRGTERIGGTQLNGNGCVCHTTIESPNVHVWIEGPDTMVQGQSALYKMKMFGGPAIAGGYNVAVRYGLLDTLDNLSVLIDNELTQNFPLPFSSTSDTVHWSFLYTAPDSVLIDTLYSVGLSTNWDTIPDERDLWAYGPKFLVRIVENVVPVELLSFCAEVIDSKVELSWVTATEKNNKGFEVESKVHSPQSAINKWERVGFVNGKGTSSQTNQYSFVDKNLTAGKFSYRLKQIDFDGTFKYYYLSEIIEVTTPGKFELFQNYPNPFNPSTRISWQSPVSSHQTFKIYDALGNEVATLINEFKEAGSYEVVLQSPVGSHQLASGVYYYQLRVGSFVETKKMIYLR